MKKYTLFLASIFLLLLISASIALAIIVPPPAPQSDPPGPSISYEQVRQITIAQKECDRIRDDVYNSCRRMGLSHEECRRRSIESYQRCLEAMKYLMDPPKLTLPNGNSPGGK